MLTLNLISEMYGFLELVETFFFYFVKKQHILGQCCRCTEIICRVSGLKVTDVRNGGWRIVCVSGWLHCILVCDMPASGVE